VRCQQIIIFLPKSNYGIPYIDAICHGVRTTTHIAFGFQKLFYSRPVLFMGSPISSFLFQTFQLSMIWPMPQKIKCSSCGKGWDIIGVHEICTKRPSLLPMNLMGYSQKPIENCLLYLVLVHTRPLQFLLFVSTFRMQ
jgi:hypothetical protein